MALACAAGLAVTGSAADRKPAPGPGEPTLAEMRAATDRFRDVKVALAEGYIPDPMNMCETSADMGRPASLGAMGIHYFRPDLLGITEPPSPRVNGTGTHTDFRNPSILIYEPTATGGLELVAIENLVFQASWKAAGHNAPPTFYGESWDTMADDPATTLDEAHMFAPHFDRHVWLYRENPNGLFAQFNPAATCAHQKKSAAHDHTGHQQ
jgi:hypothetical protein